MSFSRIAATLTLVVLFIPIVVVAIWVTLNIGTQITHGDLVEHTHGIVLSQADAGNSLMFKTDSGQVMPFICKQRCLTQLGHIQRHITERAPTDVYYKRENNTLVAVDVD